MVEQHGVSTGLPTDGKADDAFLLNPLARRLLAGFGLAMVGLGLVGLLVPVLPTTPFLILAAWAFSRSSPHFHQWLHRHPRLGPPLRAWNRYGVIPPYAKALAMGGMWGSLGLVILFVAESWVLPTVHTAVILAVSAYILSRPSQIPRQI